jgi:hypothetical protein
MYITIKRTDGTEILSGDYPDLKAAVEDCAQKGVSLIDADLVGAYLFGAYIIGASLSGADLRKADLRHANISQAKLRGAYLSRANLLRANFRGADLRGVDFSDANLEGANLEGADLYCANLSGAVLSGANLVGADMSGADLREARLCWTPIFGAILPDFQLCPQGQNFVGYKKLQDGLVATLEIAADVPRTSSLVGRKCRAQSARVLSIEAPDGTLVPDGVSIHDKNFLYRTGEIVSEPKYDPDIRTECAQGVHFFMTKEEAQKYWQ